MLGASGSPRQAPDPGGLRRPLHFARAVRQADSAYRVESP